MFLFLSKAVSTQGYSVLNNLGDPSISLMQTNPATSAVNFQAWSFRLGGASFDAGNKYIAFRKQSVFSLIRERESYLEKIDEDISTMSEIPEILNLHTYKGKKSSANIELEILGPSFSIQLPTGSLGFFANAKALGYVKSPNWDGLSEIADLSTQIPFTFPKVNVSALHYMEFGINYSIAKEIEHETILSFGANLKYYKGGELLFIKSLSEGSAIKQLDSLNLMNSEFEAGLFLNLQHDDESDQTDYSPKYFGAGGGIDLGVHYSFPSNLVKNTSIQLGLSISDLGMMTFKNGDYHLFNVPDGYTLKDEFLDEFPTNELQKDIEINGAEYISRDSKITIWAPTTLNILAELPISQSLNFGFASRLNVPHLGPIKRAEFISLIPRYQHKAAHFHFPISLYNFRFLHVGSGIHFGPIRIGSDNILPFLVKTNLRSANFYFTLELTPADLPKFLRRNSTRGSRNKRSKDKVKCYYF